MVIPSSREARRAAAGQPRIPGWVITLAVLAVGTLLCCCGAYGLYLVA